MDLMIFQTRLYHSTKEGNRRMECRKKDAMTISKLARKEHVDVHVINGYISAHRKDFAGHIAKSKTGAILDAWATNKIKKYIDNRPQKGTRFSMNKTRKEQ